jgi:CheY-like chemotaxis protein
VTFTWRNRARSLMSMPQRAAVMCEDVFSLRTLRSVLDDLGIEPVTCESQQEIVERVLGGRCSALIVDFDLPGGREIVKMAALLAPPQRPALLALARRAWPGTGEAFQSGADRILYKPLDVVQAREALETFRKTHAKNQRRSSRHEMKTLVYLDIGSATVPAIGIDISEHGFAVQATEPVPVRSNLSFRCTLPGTDYELHGEADVIWASDHGRAGLFFSKLTLAARKNLKRWLKKRGNHSKDKDMVRALLRPVNVTMCGVASE